MGHLYKKVKNFVMAGKCFRESYYGAKMIPEKADLLLYSLAWEAYECYTKMIYNLNRRPMLQEIISILEKMENGDKPESCHPVSEKQKADYYDALGHIYKESDEIESALKSYYKCLELRKKYLTEEDHIIGKVRCKIATYLYKVREYNKALEYCQIVCMNSKEYKIRTQALCIKGKIYAKKLDKNNCVSAFNKAIALGKALNKENSSDLSDIYKFLAQSYFLLDYFEESVDCFHRAYILRVESPETTPGDCLSLLYGMVDSYRMRQEYKLALFSCQKIISTLKEVNLPYSDGEARTMEIMGDLHSAIGTKSDYFNAMELYRLSAKIMRKNQGPSDGSLLRLYVKMANILGLKMNEHEKALNLFRLVLHSNLKNNANSKPFIELSALEGEGDVLFDKCAHKCAIRRYTSIMKYIDELEESDKTWKEKYEDRMNDTRVGIFCKIGCTYKFIERYELALNNLGHGLEIKNQSQYDSYNDTMAACLFYEIGMVQLKIDKREAALHKFDKARKIVENIPALSSEGESLAQDIKRELVILNRIVPFGLYDC